MEDGVKIGTDGTVDAAAVVEAIRKRAAERVASGFYDMDAIAQAERYNLSALADNAAFFNAYLTSLHKITQVDIGDWEIRERRRSVFTPLLIRLKKAIRSLLRFYTYRLWSQQNRANAIFQSSIALVARRQSEEFDKINRRLDDLERRLEAVRGETPRTSTGPNCG